jgi:hypothetical protein
VSYAQAVALDALHRAPAVARDQNTGAAAQLIEEAGLSGDATLLTALEALLNVLSATADAGGKKKSDEHLAAANSDFEALEKLRRLAFGEEVPPPKEVKAVLAGFDLEGGSRRRGRRRIVTRRNASLQCPAHTCKSRKSLV